LGDGSNGPIGFGMQRGDPDGAALCRMFNQAIAGTDLPKYLSTDNDPLYRFHPWQANLRILEVTEIKSVPYVPISHLFALRLIGTVRREYLDYVLFWNAIDLERKLGDFKIYYNNKRVHTSLEGQTPVETAGCRAGPVVDLENYGWNKKRSPSRIEPNCRKGFVKLDI
jgi:putative transposase